MTKAKLTGSLLWVGFGVVVLSHVEIILRALFGVSLL